MSADQESIRCGIKTTLKSKDGNVLLHVDWVEWDSGFRDTALRVGDDIIAVDGAPVIAAVASGDHNRQVGLDQEPAHWQSKNAADGQPVKLTVRRRKIPGTGWEMLDIAGQARAERTYVNGEGRRLLGDGGPQRLDRDEFSDSWSSWHERRCFVWERQLDGGIWEGTGDSRMALKDHLEDEDRVKYLAAHYPGAFSRSVAADWEAVRTLLQGRKYEVDPEEFRYREDEEQIVKTATAAAKQGWADFCAAHKDDLIEPPGPLSIADDDIKRLANKLLLLPPSAPENWITDVGKPFVAWQINQGWVVAQLETANFSRAWRAQMRYRHNVAPGLNDAVSIIGRILPQMRLIHPGGDAPAVIAVEVEPIAALIGDDTISMFVDLGVEGEEAPFAGEDAVRPLPVPALPDNASPQQVMETLFDALHARDDKTWFSLFARWQILIVEDEPYLYPYWPYPPSRTDPDWTKSRRVVLEQCVALRIVWVDDPVDISPHKEEGMPKIERVIIEIDHINEFDKEFRAYNSIDVHRHWHLGRRDGGPWRIMTQQGI